MNGTICDRRPTRSTSQFTLYPRLFGHHLRQFSSAKWQYRSPLLATAWHAPIHLSRPYTCFMRPQVRHWSSKNQLHKDNKTQQRTFPLGSTFSANPGNTGCACSCCNRAKLATGPAWARRHLISIVFELLTLLVEQDAGTLHPIPTFDVYQVIRMLNFTDWAFLSPLPGSAVMVYGQASPTRLISPLV